MAALRVSPRTPIPTNLSRTLPPLKSRLRDSVHSPDPSGHAPAGHLEGPPEPKAHPRPAVDIGRSWPRAANRGAPGPRTTAHRAGTNPKSTGQTRTQSRKGQGRTHLQKDNTEPIAKGQGRTHCFPHIGCWPGARVPRFTVWRKLSACRVETLLDSGPPAADRARSGLAARPHQDASNQTSPTGKWQGRSQSCTG